MDLIGVRIEYPTNQPIVLLRESHGKRFLAIWIGAMEATAIAYALEGVNTPRPFTHDLLRITTEVLGGQVTRVTVTELRDSVYYADLVLSRDGEEIHVSSRPSDAIALAPDGPLRNETFHGAYTWAGYFYRTFVRDNGLLTPQEAVRRMTSFPAARLGVTDRGMIRKGNWADLAIFDPEAFTDCGTTFHPNRVCRGMVHVLVNGTPGLGSGRLTGARPGRVLRSS